MEKQIIRTVALALLVTGLIFSCKKKDETTPEEPTTTTGDTNGGTTGATGSFQWQENGGTIQTADSSFWTTGTWGTGVRAFKGGYSNMFEINWATQNNTSVGSKTLSAANYGFTYIKSPSTYTNSIDQTLSITDNSNTKLSGNFNVAVVGGTITTITGTFTSLPKK